MKVVGLTGGIGSGKTTVAKFFLELGVPVYIADLEAKKLMNRSKVIKRKLIALFGDEAYINGTLNRPFIADKIFNDKSLLEKMNNVVHPKVKSHFNKWVKKQDAPYVIKEAAILFENGSYKQFDFLITVTATEKERIERVLKRDNTSKEKVLSIIDNQWNDAQKLALSDYEIENYDLHKTENQVNRVHLDILSRIQ